jgi:thiol:disulfide interchange protein DsbD
MSAQMAGSLSPTNVSTNYLEACRAAQAAGNALLVVIEESQDAGAPTAAIEAFSSRREALSMQVCRIDASTRLGSQLAKSYGAGRFPYAVITNSVGEIVYRGSGPFEVEVPTRKVAEEAVAAMKVEAPAGQPFEKAELTDALQRAKAANRMLVVFIKTEGCYYCVKMKQESLSSDEVQSAVTQQFVSATVQAEECQSFVNDLGIRMYPTTLILSSSGALVDRIEGFVNADQLVSRLEQATTSLVSQR